FPPHDVSVRLYDSAGNLLAFNDDFSGTDSQVQIRLTGGEQYFVVVDGFDDANSGPFNLFIESQHTEDDDLGVDDHTNTPDATLPPELRRRQFELATPIIWSDPFLGSDAFGNDVRDRSYRTTGRATGRIHNAADTDLFMFIPP